MMRDVSVNSYIIRIYRRGRGQPCVLVGIVEEVGEAKQRAFTNFHELWEILSRKNVERVHHGKGSGAF